MTRQAAAVLEAFDQLDGEARLDVVNEILRRTGPPRDSRFEEELTSTADRIFLALDEAEAETAT
jgi:hypothetical protein